MQHITLDLHNNRSALRDDTTSSNLFQDAPPSNLPEPKATRGPPGAAPDQAQQSSNAHLTFIGTATMLLEWKGVRVLTDPNFIHAGDHVQLGPGVTATRRTNPAVDLHELPRIDMVLLSHYHADHFDHEVEAVLRRDMPIVSTPHAKENLDAVVNKSSGNKDAFSAVTALDTFQSVLVDIDGAAEVGNEALASGRGESHRAASGREKLRTPAIKVTGMPGKHVPPGPLSVANDLLNGVPPSNGWILELGSVSTPGEEETFKHDYRIYISGDTLLVDELKRIPETYGPGGIDLALLHLGGTTIPSPKVPLLMVTMDAEQGIGLTKLIDAKLTIPIHYNDYDVFVSPLEDYKKRVSDAQLNERVQYLDHGDRYDFTTHN